MFAILGICRFRLGKNLNPDLPDHRCRRLLTLTFKVAFSSVGCFLKVLAFLKLLNIAQVQKIIQVVDNFHQGMMIVLLRR